MVTVDGAADWLMDVYLEEGVLPADGAFAEMARTGARAEYLTPPEASLTTPASLTMVTGTWPDQHGITGNTLHLRGDPITRSMRGFDVRIEAETLWEAARRQGKRVITVAAIADGSTPERSADQTLAYGRRLGSSLVVSLKARDDDRWSTGDVRLEHSRELYPVEDGSHLPVFENESGQKLELKLLAADTEFDGREAYDTVFLDFDRDLGDGYLARVRAGDWTPVLLQARSPRIGSWFKLLELEPDLSRARLYVGAPHQNRGAPADYVAAIDAEVGFWPGEPDGTALDNGDIDERTWLEQGERLTDFLREAALFSMKRYEFDLLLAYNPTPDEVEHRFLLFDPRQPGFEDEGGEKRRRYLNYVKDSYRQADEHLKRLRAAAPEAAFVVASDHGMLPEHTRVAVNALLASAGFRVTADETTEVRAYTSGATGHIYVNLEGREPNGVVKRRDLRRVVRRIVEVCRALRDPKTGEPVFDRVLTREEQRVLRMEHPRTSGDVWVNGRPGYSLSSRMEGPALEPATTTLGNHGHGGLRREMRAIFLAAGPGIEPASLPPATSADVAAAVSALLGIAPPKNTEGRAVVGRKP
ncbi:MAG: alkaline phosphatase family protein [Acidobacteria bacterium]|nr:alkaline phosphatase family protein [Acidobacteriota bacterium]